MVERGRLEEPKRAPAEGERFQELASIRGVIVEQILSAASEEVTVYRQEQDEWVVVLAGGAVIDVDGERCTLRPGDWLLLPAGAPHTVVRTDAGTSWLAVHVPPPTG